MEPKRDFERTMGKAKAGLKPLSIGATESEQLFVTKRWGAYFGMKLKLQDFLILWNQPSKNGSNRLNS